MDERFVTDQPEARATMSPNCALHEAILTRIEADVAEMKADQKKALERLPKLETRLALQEAVTKALIFIVSVIFTGLVGVAINAIFRHSGPAT